MVTIALGCEATPVTNKPCAEILALTVGATGMTGAGAGAGAGLESDECPLNIIAPPNAAAPNPAINGSMPKIGASANQNGAITGRPSKI